MPKNDSLPVKDLTLDLHNFRTVPQPNETSAIHALIAIDTDWFWALMESLLDDGYLPTENIIVLNSNDGTIVKEGNRRIAALKLIHSYVTSGQFHLPSHIQERMVALPAGWKTANRNVPCAVYEASEAAIADKVVALTHGKGEKAGRARWKAVARARHNRDKGGASEPGLDLLEKYLKAGKNLTQDQRERWAGDYPLSVLDEATKRLAPRLTMSSAREVADAYPSIPKYKTALDNIIRDIGLEVVRFEHIRSKDDDYASKYGIPPITPAGSSASGSSSATSHGQATQGQTASQGTTKAYAVSLDDPKAVARTLRGFSPKGKNREKVVTLLEEIRQLKLNKHPHAFCFLLRSMFEISAKAYCGDHAAAGGPKHVKANGNDKPLVDVLREISEHLTKNSADKGMNKVLHGAMTVIEKPTSILSVTSMNQLVHNPKFSIKEPDICSMFHNIFPLLEQMNS